MAIITNNIKKRFVRDYNLPITVFESEIFMYFICLYERLFKTIEKYRLLVETVEHFGNEEKFMRAFNELKNKIIGEVSETSYFETLQQTVNPFPYTAKYQIPNKNIYNHYFDGKIVGSIDLVKANFNSLKLCSGDILLNMATYEDFISHYTDVEYFKQSKQLRQIIFGNLLPKKQQSIQKSIMAEIADTLIDKTDFFDATLEENKFRSDILPFRLAKAGTDELLILDTPDVFASTNALIKFVDDIIEAIPDSYKNFIKISFFKLLEIHPEKPFFVKEFMIGDKKVEFKNVPSTFFPQAFKHYFNMEVEENDLIFFHEGCKAKFIEKIY